MSADMHMLNERMLDVASRALASIPGLPSAGVQVRSYWGTVELCWVLTGRAGVHSVEVLAMGWQIPYDSEEGFVAVTKRFKVDGCDVKIEVIADLEEVPSW